MDPLSVVGVIGVIGQITKTIYEYGNAVAEQKKEIGHLRCHLFGIQAAFNQISQDLDLAAKGGPSCLTFPNLQSLEAGLMLEETRSILEKLASVLRHDMSESRRLAKRLIWPLKRPEVQTLSANLERVKSYFILAATSDVLQVARDIHSSLQNLHESLQGMQRPEPYTNARRWLAPCDTKASFASALSVRLEGTNSWFLEGRFNDWASGKSPVLWLRGAPGSGKTCMTSACVHDLQQRKKVTAYFFCSYNNSASQDPLNIMGSLIVQLCQQHPVGQQSVLNAYEQAIARDNKLLLRERPMLVDMMMQIIDLLPTEVYLVVDAVDECGEELEAALSMLFQILTSSNKVKLTLSSRESIAQAIETAQESYKLSVDKITMDCSEVRDDVSTYIERRVIEDAKLGKLPPKLRKFVIEKLRADHQGSFRWARCTVDDLRRRHTPNDIKNALKGVNPTLGEIYAGILQRIPSDMEETVAYTLKYLVSARRQLHLPELAEAVSCALADEFGTEDRLIDPEVIISSLYSLVRYDSSNQQIQLAHSSVREFLVSPQLSREHHVDLTKANAAMSLVCVRYLALPAFRQTCPDHVALEIRKREWPFFEYASSFWTRHVRASGDMNSELERAVSGFAATADSPGGGNFAAWYQCVYPDGKPSVWLTKPLYMYAREGLSEILRILVKDCSKDQLERRGGARGSTALHVAATYGETEAVRILLEAGASPHEQNDAGESGIQWAAFYSHRDVVDLLLKYGVSRELFSREHHRKLYIQMLHQYRISHRKPDFENSSLAVGEDGELDSAMGLWT